MGGPGPILLNLGFWKEKIVVMFQQLDKETKCMNIVPPISPVLVLQTRITEALGHCSCSLCKGSCQCVQTVVGTYSCTG